MLRSLLSGVMRSRSGTTAGAGYGRRGLGRGHGAADPGSAVGAQVGRSLFSMLRRR